MEREVIVTDKALLSKIERCHYEYNAYLNIEKSYLDDHLLDENGSALDSPMYMKFHDRTVSALKAYEDAKAELSDLYDLGAQPWRLDFQNGVIKVG